MRAMARPQRMLMRNMIEIHEYAKFIGMDIEKEKELLWIARESLKAPLPPDWKPW